MDIKTIGVVGAGSMGNGIAQVCAAGGLTSDHAGPRRGVCAARAVHHPEAAWASLWTKGKISAEDRDAIVGRITATTNLEDLSGADLVIEAVV